MVPPVCALDYAIATVTRAISQLTSGKAAGADGLPPELFKINCPSLTNKLTKLFGNIWHNGTYLKTSRTQP